MVSMSAYRIPKCPVKCVCDHAPSKITSPGFSLVFVVSGQKSGVKQRKGRVSKSSYQLAFCG